MIKIFIFFCFLHLIYLNSYAVENNQLLQIEKNINISIENQIQLQIEEDQLKSQISDILTKIKGKKLAIVNRLKAIYALKKFQWGELLVQNNFNEFERNLKILKNLNKYDYSLFKDYKMSFIQLNLAKKNLLETEALIKKGIADLKKQQEEFHKFEKIKIDVLKSSNKNSLLLYKGQLQKPLDAYLKTKFGTLQDQHNKFYLVSFGEHYVAKSPTPITAIGPGTVIFRDELQRWRETLIVQHADNYYSVYAGIKNLKKSVGDPVSLNELLGVTASEDFYFEMRHCDSPINPRAWYKE